MKSADSSIDGPKEGVGLWFLSSCKQNHTNYELWYQRLVIILLCHQVALIMMISKSIPHKCPCNSILNHSQLPQYLGIVQLSLHLLAPCLPHDYLRWILCINFLFRISHTLFSIQKITPFEPRITLSDIKLVDIF